MAVSEGTGKYPENPNPQSRLLVYSDSQLHIVSSVCVVRILDKLPSAGAQCQVRNILPVDMIYTDIVGLIQFKRKVRSGYAKFR